MCIVSISAVAVVLMFQEKKKIERFVFVFFLRATELQISSAKNTFLLFQSFS